LIRENRRKEAERILGLYRDAANFRRMREGEAERDKDRGRNTTTLRPKRDLAGRCRSPSSNSTPPHDPLIDRTYPHSNGDGARRDCDPWPSPHSLRSQVMPLHRCADACPPTRLMVSGANEMEDAMNFNLNRNDLATKSTSQLAALFQDASRAITANQPQSHRRNRFSR
jgi:hypothetical protein